MAFDQSTRGCLQRFVNEARKVLEEEFTRQLQNDYGMDPVSSEIAELTSLRHINDAQRETARILRDTLAHYCAAGDMDIRQGLDRIVREQAFTVLNRLGALRMAEARGLLVESVCNGFQAKGFQLYARLASTGLGETGDAYRTYLFSVFDELSQDLPGLFDRFSPQGRLFPREAALLLVLRMINDAEIAPLWSEDETIGWIYQYFNSKEERKAMRDASQAPRNSRELAVRNQFFTPRYVVEFLVDNTLGRLWFNATGGQTSLRERCHYLLVKPNETLQAASKLRDPRTLKLLDPACGSMHFGLYAFDLFTEIYREAWAWEQQHGQGSLDLSTHLQAGLKPLSQTYVDQAEFLRDVPRLIIEHNVYGVDIDPRAAQIASLALWLRAQRAWHDTGIKAKDRPLVGRGHVVAATAPPAEQELRQQFSSSLDKRDAALFEKTLDLLKGLPELGVLLQVERELRMLRRGGRLGAITSRTCFFLTSFTEWRKKVVLGLSGVEVIADLGQGVMDDAMVEAAAYVLERGVACHITNVIRAIADEDRHKTLALCVTAYRQDHSDARLFQAEKRTFDLLPDSPFVYWVDAGTIQQFSSKERFEPDVGNVRQGLATGDDPRFVRAVWEVAPKDTQFCYYPTNDEAFCQFDDPVVQAYYRRRSEGTPRWAFHVKAGASQPWYSPITLKVNWHLNGAELRNFTDAKGKLRSRPQNVGFYYRPGFSWTRRAVRFYPYVIPSSCIPSVSRYMAFPDPGREIEALGVCASRLCSAFMRFYAEFWQRPNFLVENVKMLPWPKLTLATREYFGTIIAGEVEKRRQAYQNYEPFHEFVLPSKVCDYSGGGTALEFDRQSLIGKVGERLVAEAYGFTPQQAEVVERDLSEAIVHQHGSASELDDEGVTDEDSEFVLDTSPYATEEAHISYLLGCAFGRWDVRFATGERQPEPLADPFAPMPVCPPGMLQNTKGLPALAHELPHDYPLTIAWSGVLVDDEGHRADVVECVRTALRTIWRERADAAEEEACAQLRCKSLRDYFRRSSGLFSDHLKRYTKSGRKAPIYWPLATASGSYALWIYYPNLSSQTLYTAINDFVEPRLKLVGSDVKALRDKGANRARDEEKQFETSQIFELELIELRDALLRLAPTYKPDLNDGVQIGAAPLWPLFRHKPWQKVLKDTWTGLEAGDYDWAQLAMHYWPERVREKCKSDKSLAITHDLENLYIEPQAKPKKPRGTKKAGGDE